MVSTSSERRALGDRLKRQRERRGIALESISRSTKIPTALFAGLERGDCSRWPVGIYSRAYVRCYAEAIGLNGDEIVEDFISAYGSTARPDGDGRAPSRSRGAVLRLSLVEEPAITPERLAHRVALAGTDFLAAASLGAVIHIALDASLLPTLGAVLTYHFVARLVSDQPLVWWAVRRARAAAARPAPVPQEEVAVGDAASTAA